MPFGHDQHNTRKVQKSNQSEVPYPVQAMSISMTHKLSIKWSQREHQTTKGTNTD